MKVNKIILASAFSLCCVISQAQDFSSIIFGQDTKIDYIGQYNQNGKRKNGFGIQRYNNGNLYVGDFNENNITGKGMLICNNKEINNVDGAYVYIGNWYKGKKQGKGVCYGKTGDVVFQGKFDNDKPQINDASKSYGRVFKMINLNEELYIGEIKDKLPNGYGLKLQDDGGIYIGNMVNGEPTGLCMTFYGTDIWKVGQWSDGVYNEIKDSHQVQKDLVTYKQNVKQKKREMWADFSKAGEDFAQIATSIATNSSENNAMEGNDGGNVGNIPTGKSRDYYQTQYNDWAYKAKAVYDDRVSHKIKSNATGDANYARQASADARLLRSRQQMMRQIRLTAQKAGYSIKISEYEKCSF